MKNRFSRWRPWRPSWISDQNDFIYLSIYFIFYFFILFYFIFFFFFFFFDQQVGQSVQEKNCKNDFKTADMASFLDFRSE